MKIVGRSRPNQINININYLFYVLCMAVEQVSQIMYCFITQTCEHTHIIYICINYTHTYTHDLHIYLFQYNIFSYHCRSVRYLLESPIIKLHTHFSCPSQMRVMTQHAWRYTIFHISYCH